MSQDDSGLEPRLLKGFRDIFAAEVRARRAMIETIRAVYEKYGFEPLETPSIEHLEVLGKYLADADVPEQGVYAFRDDSRNWVSLRYDLTAPLSRVVAQYGQELPTPFRRYQIGPVWRLEKPGPGRFREFYQFDIDTVGTSSIAADAEVCAVIAESLEALGIQRGSYVIRVNNRKILNGVLENAKVAEDTQIEVQVERDDGSETVKVDQRLAVLRTMDKLDRLGIEGLKELLGKGRKDESGDFTPGAHLNAEQIEYVIRFMQSGQQERSATCDAMAELVGGSEIGMEGIAELREMDGTLTAMGFASDRVVFDPSVVRGLGYYTGPVFEAELTFEITNEEGVRQQFGSVAGGGRYDNLVQRFTGKLIPATGISIGVDRLLAALEEIGKNRGFDAAGPIVVTVLHPERMSEYQQMAAELRAEGLSAETYLGSGKMKQQLKYADRRRAPVAVIAGEDELSAGDVSIKDLGLGAKLASQIEGRDEWRKGQPAQVRVKRAEMVRAVREILARGR